MLCARCCVDRSLSGRRGAEALGILSHVSPARFDTPHPTAGTLAGMRGCLNSFCCGGPENWNRLGSTPTQPTFHVCERSLLVEDTKHMSNVGIGSAVTFKLCGCSNYSNGVQAGGPQTLLVPCRHFVGCHCGSPENITFATY